MKDQNMTSLPDPRIEACSLARVVGSRSRAISNLSDQIAAISNSGATEMKPEEWLILSSSLEKLMNELDEEIKHCTQKMSYAW
jgi:hypothetical protein